MRAARKPRATLAVLPMAMVALWTGACGGLVGSPRTPPEEVERLKRQVVELKQRATVAELDGERLQREIERLEAELEQTRAELETATSIEPNTPAPLGLDQKIEETDLEPAPLITEPVAAEPIAADSPAAPAQVATSAEAQALYDEGYDLFHQQRYTDAEARFRRFVELHPRTDLADNALFWLGECRYAQRDYSGALEAFSDTVERYPEGNKVADAMLKAGKCLETLGDPQQALRTYRELVERFPSTAAAAQARELLDRKR